MKFIVGGALAAALAALGALFGWADTGVNPWVEKALASRPCPASPEAPDFGPSYTGPLIDTHMHIPHHPEDAVAPSSNPFPLLGDTLFIADYECVFSQEGITTAFAFFPVYPGWEESHLAIVKGAIEKYPGVFAPFIMPPDDDGSSDGFPTVTAAHLEEMLAPYPDLFAGYGEIGLYARGDHGGPKGAPALPPDSKRLQEIYPVIREHNLLVYFHLGEGQQDAMERAAAENPDINFIFHGDQLVTYENGGQNLTAIDEILGRHPNVYYGVDELYGDVWLLHPEKTKEEFMAHFRNYEKLLKEDVRTWKAFIERHSDQVLWGTDRGVANLWSMDPDVGMVLTGYARAFIARLDPAVREKFTHENAERLIAEVRE